MRRTEPRGSGGGHRMRRAVGWVGRIVVHGWAAAVIVGPLTAQVPWEGPRLLGSAEPGGFGVHWVDYGTLPGDGMGVLITVSGAGLPDGARLRGGFAEGAYGTNAGFAGLDLWGPRAARSGTLPVDPAPITGWAGGAFAQRSARRSSRALRRWAGSIRPRSARMRGQ